MDRKTSLLVFDFRNWSQDVMRKSQIFVPFATIITTEVKVKLSLCLINLAQCNEDVWRSGGIAPPFLTSTLKESVVSFTPRPLYPWEKSPRYPLNMRLSWPWSRSGRCGEKSLTPAGNWTPPFKPVA
jgi:hypothetical protein